MTVVAGLADPASNSVILVADSRVMARNGMERFDICQKVAQLGDQGLFGFAGPIDPAAEIAHGITGTYRERGVGWLTSKSEVMGLLSRFGALGRSNLNEFVVAFMDGPKPSAGRATIVRFSTDGDYGRTRLGFEIIGSGSETYAAIRPMLTDVLNFGGPGRGGIALAQRALFFSEIIVGEAKIRSIDSVGGLMQVHFVEAGGVRALPYERWVPIGDGMGTYVLMDIDRDGAWVQLHEPSALRVPLRYPSEAGFRDALESKDTNFELKRLLTRESPGVEPTPNPVRVYRPLLSDTGGWLVRTPGR